MSEKNTNESPSMATPTWLSPHSANEWREQVRNTQRLRMTPDALQTLRDKADRHKRVELASKKAEFLERCGRANVKSQGTNLLRSRMATPQSDEMYHDITSRNALQSSTMRTMLSAAASPAPFSQRDVKAKKTDKNIWTFVNKTDKQEAEEENDDEAEQARVREREEQQFSEQLNVQLEVLSVLEKEIDENERQAHAELEASGTPALPSRESDFASLLHSLAAEPGDAAEVAAKFSIYETFLESVVEIREQTVALWRENREQFAASAKAHGDRAIREIDSAESMGIAFEESRHWFVYEMMRKAHENHRRIAAVLADIRSKLQLLIAQDEVECPFCLEAIAQVDAVVLGCCHRSCRTCWTHWEEIKGHAAFCPLCRHDEFVREIVL